MSYLDPGSVIRFRLSLWTELLGSPKGMIAWTPVHFVSEWDPHHQGERGGGNFPGARVLVWYEGGGLGEDTLVVVDRHTEASGRWIPSRSSP